MTTNATAAPRADDTRAGRAPEPFHTTWSHTMTEQPVGPHCGNNPNARLTDHDRKAVADFKARLALQAAVKPYVDAAAWVDGDPLMEVIAATVWKHCARDDQEMPQAVCDDPRTIAAFATAVARAHATAPPSSADRAAVERVRAVLETEAVVGRSALEYRGLIVSALMAAEAQQQEPGCTCSHPADEHSVYGCADGCGCERMPKRPPMDPVHILGIEADAEAQQQKTAQGSRCPSCDHEAQYHDADGRCWFTVDSGVPGSNLVCPCAPRRVNDEEDGAQQQPDTEAPMEETGAALARYIADRPMSEIQGAFRILGWPPLRFELVEAEVPAPVAQQPAAADRLVAHRPVGGRSLHCLSCAPDPAGDNWEPVTAEELEDGGVCTVCGVDVLIPQQAAAAETDEERADREATERDHARGDHTYCGITCETEMPTEHLRNFVIAKGYPGTRGALDELLRRARAEVAEQQAAAEAEQDDTVHACPGRWGGPNCRCFDAEPAPGEQQAAAADGEETRRRCAHRDVVYGRCILPIPGHLDCFHERQPIRADDQGAWGDGLCDSEYPGDDNFVGQLCALPEGHFGDHRRDEAISGTSHTALLRWRNHERP